MRRIVVLLLFMTFLTSCGKYDLSSAKVNYLTPDPTIVKIDVGESCSLKVNAELSDGTTKEVTSQCEFSIYSGGEYFTLKKGKVTGVARGGGVITIDYNNQLTGSKPVHVGL